MSSCKLHSIDRTPSKLKASEHAVVVRKSQPVWICKWSEVKSPFMSAGWRWITVRGAEINTEMAGVADRNRIHIQRPRCQPIPSACSSSHFISAPSLPSPVYFLPAPGSDFLNILLWIELERMDINKVAVACSSCRDWTVGCVHWCRAAVLSTVMSSAISNPVIIIVSNPSNAYSHDVSMFFVSNYYFFLQWWKPRAFYCTEVQFWQL